VRSLFKSVDFVPTRYREVVLTVSKLGNVFRASEGIRAKPPRE